MEQLQPLRYPNRIEFSDEQQELLKAAGKSELSRDQLRILKTACDQQDSVRRESVEKELGDHLFRLKGMSMHPGGYGYAEREREYNRNNNPNLNR